jgi:polysaccharide export outer membrane protein
LAQLVSWFIIDMKMAKLYNYFISLVFFDLDCQSTMPIYSKFILSTLLVIGLGTPALFAESHAEEYQVGIADVLTITVAGEDDFSGNYTVRNDGTIFYSYLKKVPVNGLTLRQINDKLTQVLASDYINNPILSIAVKEYASKKVQVLGAVNKPGSYILRGPTRVLDIVSQAGGLAAMAGRNILIIRSADKTRLAKATGLTEKVTDTKNGNIPETMIDAPGENITEPIIVNYSDIVERGKLENNILLKSGDVINVPKADEVYVLGQVNKPGSIKFESNLTILQAVSLAGGTSEVASTKSTYVIRKSKDGKSNKIKVRLDKILAKKVENFPLQANDVIVIPESFF